MIRKEIKDIINKEIKKMEAMLLRKPKNTLQPESWKRVEKRLKILKEEINK